MKRFAICLALSGLLTGGTALAQSSPDATDAILVFDASGSMWGQIDGVNKIVIARDVVSKLLDELPASRRLGLMAYGHNRKGDCSDIQMLAPVGTDRAGIRSAVMGLNPKGMTPMAAAVQLAAEELKFTENKATVILVSDGEETCHADPCQAVAALEKLGVDLTVHTVGFGLESAEAKKAREQLQCMAEHTGGQFFTADNAQELAEALTLVATTAPTAPAAPAAPAVPARQVDSILQATDGEGGAPITQGLSWVVRDGGTGEILHQADNAGRLELALKPGIKDVRVERLSDGAAAEGSFNPAKDARYTLPIVVHYDAALSAPATAVAGSVIRVTWEGPDRERDYLSVERPDKHSNAASSLEYTYTEEGSPLALRMPSEPGTYEIRYIQNQGYKTLARQTIEVTPVGATLEAPTTAAAGSEVRVSWAGPDYRHDYLSVERPDKGSNAASSLEYTYTEEGSPLALRMPSEPGTYEIRYIQNQDYKTLARHTIEVTPVSATLEAPATAVAGSEVRVSWAGPDYRHDYLSVEHPDKDSNAASSLQYTYTEEGSPLALRMPSEPGTYEIRYIQNQGYKTLARHMITVTAAP
ncbi:VWA domain-containing protein [Castellaniella sp.]|uniref:vWA domain-containing protein n=1 Tax=Castellaniella sp. TaxID=1955812 RepID=UPI00356443A3